MAYYRSPNEFKAKFIQELTRKQDNTVVTQTPFVLRDQTIKSPNMNLMHVNVWTDSRNVSIGIHHDTDDFLTQIIHKILGKTAMAVKEDWPCDSFSIYFEHLNRPRTGPDNYNLRFDRLNEAPHKMFGIDTVDHREFAHKTYCSLLFYDQLYAELRKRFSEAISETRKSFRELSSKLERDQHLYP